jgi:acetyl-CoA carboxylase carboxyl transferase subunit beta
MSVILENKRKTPGITNPKDLKNNPFSAPEGFWIRCNQCSNILQHSKLEENLMVCPECSHHFPISARQRIKWLADNYQFNELDNDIKTQDILNFKDSKSYPERLVSSQKKTLLNDAFVSAEVKINKRAVQCHLLPLQ